MTDYYHLTISGREFEPETASRTRHRYRLSLKLTVKTKTWYIDDTYYYLKVSYFFHGQVSIFFTYFTF